MIDFLKENWILILAIIVIIGLLIFFALKGKKEIVYKILYALVTEAERIYGEKTGSVKFAYVVEKAYSYLPPILKIFITYDALRDMIEKALDQAKIKWAKEAGVELYINRETQEKPSAVNAKEAEKGTTDGGSAA